MLKTVSIVKQMIAYIPLPLEFGYTENSQNIVTPLYLE
jgi:hypothetical protein